MTTDADRDENEETRQPGSSGRKRHIVVTSNQIDARDLFAGTREISIVHGGEMYRMRLTAQNKLILTK